MVDQHEGRRFRCLNLKNLEDFFYEDYGSGLSHFNQQ
jgi:hypothetical protein